MRKQFRNRSGEGGSNLAGEGGAPLSAPWPLSRRGAQRKWADSEKANLAPCELLLATATQNAGWDFACSKPRVGHRNWAWVGAQALLRIHWMCHS